ncbi:MAG: glycosyltransferase family 4 protein [Rickettsiales bacterium]|nr:glycosyltransferase family 4 protein [Rickettsiales bacterium]
MRIVHLLLSRSEEIGKRLYDCVSGEVALGHDVAVISHAKANINTSLRLLPISLLGLHPLLGEKDARAISKLGPLLRTLRADVLICHDSLALNFARKAIQFDKPTLAMVDSAPFAWASAADAVLTQRPDFIAPLVVAGSMPDRVFHLPPMIEQRGGFIRSVWQQPPTILVNTSLEEHGGIAVFLRALAHVKSEGTACRAMIVGEGLRLYHVRRLARKLGVESIVEFIPPREHMDALLRSVDIYCQPSTSDINGRVLLTAMAAKLPILLTNTSGLSDMLVPDEEAIFVTAGDAEAMAGGLRRLLEDEDQARTMASQAFHRLKRSYTRERGCQLLMQIIQEVTTRHAHEHGTQRQVA